jgi:hypothetical protein
MYNITQFVFHWIDLARRLIRCRAAAAAAATAAAADGTEADGGQGLRRRWSSLRFAPASGSY